MAIYGVARRSVGGTPVRIQLNGRGHLMRLRELLDLDNLDG